jgi:Tol biopolymer transport system component
MPRQPTALLLAAPSLAEAAIAAASSPAAAEAASQAPAQHVVVRHPRIRGDIAEVIHQAKGIAVMHRLALAMTVAVLAFAAPAAANGLITYERSNPDAGDIPTLWSAQIGDVSAQITQCSGCLQDGAERSHDGTRIYFDSDLVPPIHVFSSKLDGTDVHQITFSASHYEGYPTLSPSDQYLVYDGQDDDFGHNQGLYKARVDATGSPQRLAVPPNGFADINPAWSPDGETIAFQRMRFSGCGWRCRSHAKFGPQGFASSIYLMDSDGSHIRRLTADTGHSWGDPSWAPDSRSLLVQAWSEHTTWGASSDEYSIDVDGRGLRRITNGKREFWYSGDYSADGSRIAITHVPPSLDRIEIVDMAADASDQHVVATCFAPFNCNHPNW